MNPFKNDDVDEDLQVVKGVYQSLKSYSKHFVL